MKTEARTSGDPKGVITSFGFSAASVVDQPLAETFFTGRRHPISRLGTAVRIASRVYVADKGFEGAENHQRCLNLYGALLNNPSKRNSRTPCPKGLRRWLVGIRQIVETVYDKLLNTLSLHQERAHELSGVPARLAARVPLQNFCIWLNKQLGRPRLSFANLLGR